MSFPLAQADSHIYIYVKVYPNECMHSIFYCFATCIVIFFPEKGTG